MDDRIQFNDLSFLPEPARHQRSRIIQFYSHIDNIGNFTPVLGIQEMLGFTPDCWSIHRVPVNFDYINENYDGAIIGGAGLLNRIFSPFWNNIKNNCRIPYIIWGVGACFEDGNARPGVDTNVVQSVIRHSDLVNLRDRRTRSYYGFQNANVSACPTLEWVRQHPVKVQHNHILFSLHPELITMNEKEQILKKISSLDRPYISTDNVQSFNYGLSRMVEKLYGRASVVVTSRLHGAIIAAGIGVPYIAYARDEKIRSFCSEYGGGKVIEKIDELPAAYEEIKNESWPLSPDVTEKIRDFGKKANDWVEYVTTTTR